MRRLLPLLVLALLCGCATGDGSSTIASTAPLNAAPDTVASVPYEDPAGYAIRYPLGWQAQPNTDLVTDAETVSGTAFVPRMSIGIGSDYLEGYVHVQSAAPPCPASDPAAEHTIIGTHPVEKTAWSSAAAGSLYRGTAYRLRDRACLTVTVYVRTCALGPNCGEGRERPFDRDGFAAIAERMIESIEIR